MFRFECFHICLITFLTFEVSHEVSGPIHHMFYLQVKSYVQPLSFAICLKLCHSIVNTCEGLQKKIKYHLNSYEEKKNPRFYLGPRVVRKKKDEQVKVAHWNPTWVLKKDPKLFHSQVKTCESPKTKKHTTFIVMRRRKQKRILHFILGQEL